MFEMDWENFEEMLRSCLDCNGALQGKRYAKMMRNNLEFAKFTRKNYPGHTGPDIVKLLLVHGLKQGKTCGCVGCNNPVHLVWDLARQNTNNGFTITCSPACSGKMPQRQTKIAKTKLERYNGNGFASTVTSAKARKTMKDTYGVEYYVLANDFLEKSHKTSLDNFGVDHHMKIDGGNPNHINVIIEKYGARNILCKESSIREEIYDRIEELYGSRNPMHSSIIREKMYDEGKWSRPEEYAEYITKVWSFTNVTINENTILNIEKRGRLDLNPNAYHLDHRVSIKFGFVNNIDPKIIASIYNLEMIPARVNCSKRADCSITIDELLSQYKDG